MKSANFNLYPEGKIPFIWYIDDANIFVTDAFYHKAPLYEEQRPHSDLSGFTFVNYIITQVDPKVKVTFPLVVSPEYEASDILWLHMYDKSLADGRLSDLNRQFQRWLREHRENAEVGVHGWSHWNRDYLTDGSWETMPGVGFNRRSEWYRHPDPASNLEHCAKALRMAGYEADISAMSICGGRMDGQTMQALRRSKYQVKSFWQTSDCWPYDIGREPGRHPVYVEEMDVWVVPPLLEPSFDIIEQVEALIDARVPISYCIHAYEPTTDAYHGEDLLTVRMFEHLREHRANQVAYMTMGEYSRFLAQQTAREN